MYCYCVTLLVISNQNDTLEENIFLSFFVHVVYANTRACCIHMPLSTVRV